MKKCIAICLFAFGSVAAAQVTGSQAASTPKTKVVKSHALLVCETQRDQFQKWSLENATRLDAVNAELKKLMDENAQLQRHYNDAFAVLSVLNSEIHGWTPSEPQVKLLHEIPPDDLALSFGIQSETAVQKLVEHDSMAVEKYNGLLTDYKLYVGRVDSELAQLRQGYAQQQRINNALAIYNLLPKYQPIPPPVLLVPQTQSIHCTSQRFGDQTTTDCH